MPLNYAVLAPNGDVQLVGAMHESPEAMALLAEIGGVALTDAQADQIGRAPGLWRIAPDGTLGPRPPAEPPLAEAQAKAALAVDQAAEAVRLRFLTAGSGQALVYSQKKDETDRFLARFADAAASASAGSADFPLINAEVGITAPTPWEVAQAMRAMSDQWTLVAAAIETTRLSAKAAIAAATSLPGIQKAQAAVVWPSVPS